MDSADETICERKFTSTTKKAKMMPKLEICDYSSIKKVKVEKINEFSCEIWPKIYLTNDWLNKHYKERRQFNCNKCGTTYKDAEKLKEHVDQRHQPLKPKIEKPDYDYVTLMPQKLQTRKAVVSNF